MSTLSRYILREHLGPFVLGFALILFVLLLDVVLQTLDQVLSKGLAAGLAGELLFYNLAWIVALAAPMAVLIAVLMAFARLAADNEVLAAKACGVGFHRLLRPVLASAAVLAVLMILFNDLVLPAWNHRARVLTTSLRRRKAALAVHQLEGTVVHGLGAYSLLVREVDRAANLLRGITLFISQHGGYPTSLYAPSGRLELLADGSYTLLELRDGELLRFEVDAPARVLHARFARQVLHIDDPDRAFQPQESSYRSDREMRIGEMHAAVQRRQQEYDQSQTHMDSLTWDYVQQLAAAAEPQQATEFERVTRTTRAELERHRQLNANRLRRMNQFRVEIHKKFSIPVACLVFVLVGAPLGVMIRRRGVAVSIGISLFFFWIYWMFLIGGEELADRGFVGPALAMWAPNGLFGLLGALLVLRTALDQSWGRHLPRTPAP